MKVFRKPGLAVLTSDHDSDALCHHREEDHGDLEPEPEHARSSLCRSKEAPLLFLVEQRDDRHGDADDNDV